MTDERPTWLCDAEHDTYKYKTVRKYVLWWKLSRQTAASFANAQTRQKTYGILNVSWLR